jgi:Leucine-rich repeat (LRR) protein
MFFPVARCLFDPEVKGNSMRFRMIGVIVATGFVPLLAGCGKVPTWGELTGPQAPAAPNAVAPPVAPASPVTIMPPAEPSSAEVIARFNGLRPAEISDSAIMRLTSLKEGTDQITEINADGSAVSKEAFGAIEKLTNLRQLRLNGSRVDNEACQKIAMLSSLEVLALTDTPVSDVGVAALSGLQNLKQLELSRCALTENGFAAIGKLPSLKSISIESTNLDDRTFDLVCNARTLTHLLLTRNQITDFGLAELKKLDALEFLELSHNSRVTCAGLATAGKGGAMKHMEYLGVYACPLNDQGAKAINNIKSLQRLNVGEIGTMTDLGFANLAKGMKNLKFVNLSKCANLDGSGLKVLEAARDLEELQIDQCGRIGDNVIRILKTFKNLKRLTLGSTAITPSGIAELQAALPNLKIYEATDRAPNITRGKFHDLRRTPRISLIITGLPCCCFLVCFACGKNLMHAVSKTLPPKSCDSWRR